MPSLAKKLTNNSRKCLLVAADVYRPAAIEQLKLLGEKINVPVFSIEEKNARNVAKQAIALCKRDKT